MESWQSGLSRTPAKGVNLHGFRGFKSLPFRHFQVMIYGPVAQGLEQLAHNQLVVGSNPTRPTNKFLLYINNSLIKLLIFL